MIVYDVWWDNGEMYEDAYSTSEGLFATYDLAVKYIEGKGYEKTDDEYDGRDEWERETWEHDPDTGRILYRHPVETMWIVEREVREAEPPADRNTLDKRA